MQDGVFTDARTPVAEDDWRALARVLDAIGYGVGLWVILWPQPYKLAVASAMAAFLAALAIKVLSHQKLRITDAKSGDVRPRLQALLLMPALALSLRALQDVNLLDWRPALISALILAAAFALPLFVGDRELAKKPFFAGFLALLTYAYAWGAIAEANMIFDASPAHVFQTTIRSMRAHHGKMTSYHLVLGPWDGRPAGDDAQTSYAFYAAHRPGDPVCVALRSGWLGYRYYEARSCW